MTLDVPDERLLETHWLYEWIDEEGIRRPGDYIKAIRKRGSFERLRELSDLLFESNNSGGPDSGGVDSNVARSVLASRRLDLSGTMACPHFECMSPVVDQSFGRAWHYFDTIVIDVEPLDVALYSGDDIGDLLQFVRLLLYFRHIGADKHLKFTHKIGGMCSQHFREYAKQQHLGLDAILDKNFEREIVRKLTSEGRLELTLRDDHWHYEIEHPDTGTLSGSYAHSKRDHKPTFKQVARDAYGSSCAGLISDVSASKKLGMPIFQAAENRWLLTALEDSPPEETTVALSLHLPVFRNVPIKEVLKFRDQNWAAFERFRSALQAAVKEQIQRSGSESPQKIADEVVAEYIRPELAEIDQQLTGTKRALARKIGANIAVSTAIVSVGTIEKIPFLMAGTFVGAYTVAAVPPIISETINARSAAENLPLYFLWKAKTSHRIRH